MLSNSLEEMKDESTEQSDSFRFNISDDSDNDVNIILLIKFV